MPRSRNHLRAHPQTGWWFSLAILLAAAPGCSLAFVDAPARHNVRPEPGECTSSYGWPITDTVLATTLLVGGVSTLFSDAAGTDAAGVARGVGYVLGLGMFALAVLPAVSARIGYSKVANCRAASDPAPTAPPSPSPASKRRYNPMF